MIGKWIGKDIAIIFSGERTSIAGKLLSADEIGVKVRTDRFANIERIIPWTAIAYVELEVSK